MTEEKAPEPDPRAVARDPDPAPIEVDGLEESFSEPDSPIDLTESADNSPSRRRSPDESNLVPDSEDREETDSKGEEGSGEGEEESDGEANGKEGEDRSEEDVEGHEGPDGQNAEEEEKEDLSEGLQTSVPSLLTEKVESEKSLDKPADEDAKPTTPVSLPDAVETPSDIVAEMDKEEQEEDIADLEEVEDVVKGEQPTSAVEVETEGVSDVKGASKEREIPTEAKLDATAKVDEDANGEGGMNSEGGMREKADVSAKDTVNEETEMSAGGEKKLEKKKAALDETKIVGDAEVKEAVHMEHAATTQVVTQSEEDAEMEDTAKPGDDGKGGGDELNLQVDTKRSALEVAVDQVKDTQAKTPVSDATGDRTGKADVAMKDVEDADPAANFVQDSSGKEEEKSEDVKEIGKAESKVDKAVEPRDEMEVDRTLRDNTAEVKKAETAEPTHDKQAQAEEQVKASVEGSEAYATSAITKEKSIQRTTPDPSAIPGKADNKGEADDKGEACLKGVNQKGKADKPSTSQEGKEEQRSLSPFAFFAKGMSAPSQSSSPFAALSAPKSASTAKLTPPTFGISSPPKVGPVSFTSPPSFHQPRLNPAATPFVPMSLQKGGETPPPKSTLSAQGTQEADSTKGSKEISSQAITPSRGNETGIDKPESSKIEESAIPVVDRGKTEGAVATKEVEPTSAQESSKHSNAVSAEAAAKEDDSAPHAAGSDQGSGPQIQPTDSVKASTAADGALKDSKVPAPNLALVAHPKATKTEGEPEGTAVPSKVSALTTARKQKPPGQSIQRIPVNGGIIYRIERVAIIFKEGKSRPQRRSGYGGVSTVELKTSESGPSLLEFTEGDGDARKAWMSISSTKDEIRVKKVTNRPYVLSIAVLGPSGSEKGNDVVRYYLHLKEETFQTFMDVSTKYLQDHIVPRERSAVVSFQTPQKDQKPKHAMATTPNRAGVTRPEGGVAKHANVDRDQKKLLSEKMEALRKKKAGKPSDATSKLEALKAAAKEGTRMRKIGTDQPSSQTITERKEDKKADPKVSKPPLSSSGPPAPMKSKAKPIPSSPKKRPAFRLEDQVEAAAKRAKLTAPKKRQLKVSAPKPEGRTDVHERDKPVHPTPASPAKEMEVEQKSAEPSPASTPSKRASATNTAIASSALSSARTSKVGAGKLMALPTPKGVVMSQEEKERLLLHGKRLLDVLSAIGLMTGYSSDVIAKEGRPGLRRCEVTNSSDFFDRLHTFEIATWPEFAQRHPLNPVECARRGWYNSGLNQLKSTDGAEVQMNLESCSDLDAHLDEERRVEKLVTGEGHKLLSGWIGQSCPVEFETLEGSLRTYNERQLRENAACMQKEHVADEIFSKESIDWDIGVEFLAGQEKHNKLAVFNWTTKSGVDESLDLYCSWCNRNIPLKPDSAISHQLPGSMQFALKDTHYPFCPFRISHDAAKRNAKVMGIPSPVASTEQDVEMKDA